MGFFPFFIDIEKKKCVIVGGGKVALRKIEKLLPFKPEITVIAPLICNEIRILKDVKIVQRAFIKTDLDNAYMVIAATNDEDVNSMVYEICREKIILVNTVDDQKKCSFIFPAIAGKDDLTIGVSTSGRSPIMAKYIREQIDEIIDDRMLKILDIMEKNRPMIKKKHSDESERKSAMQRLLTQCIRADGEMLNGFITDAENLEDSEYEAKNRDSWKSTCDGSSGDGSR